jgi:hypothetical protein
MSPRARATAIGAFLAWGAACGGAEFTSGGDEDGGTSADAPAPPPVDAGGSGDSPAPPRDAPSHADVVAFGDAVGSADARSIDASPPDSPATRPHRIFVSSTGFAANFGGLSGADAQCQLLANAVPLGGTWAAWLSSSTTSAASRLTHGLGPYTLINGTVVAASFADLISGTIKAPINVNEKGGAPPTVAVACAATNAPLVWTGTTPQGTISTGDYQCADWTSQAAGPGAVWGGATFTDGEWTNWCSSVGPASTACTITAALYCIEQ